MCFRSERKFLGSVDLVNGYTDVNTVPTYTFDYEHRLVGANGAVSCSYSYDGGGNRLEAVRDGATTRYIYDAAGNLLAEADANNVITRYYIYGLGLMAMATPTDEIYCYHFNAIGSTIAMTDATQVIVNKYAYTAFGITANEEETVTQPFKYVGQHGVMTEPNGLQYMRARYYDPEVGRFISEDPLGFGGGDVNLYVYCKNNPILLVDPWGLCAKNPSIAEQIRELVSNLGPETLYSAGAALAGTGATLVGYGASMIAVGGPVGWVGGGIVVVVGTATTVSGVGAVYLGWQISN